MIPGPTAELPGIVVHSMELFYGLPDGVGGAIHPGSRQFDWCPEAMTDNQGDIVTTIGCVGECLAIVEFSKLPPRS